MHETCFFRAGVGVILVDPAGAVLAFERARIPGAWQLVQGGIRKCETVHDAAEREILEETGIEARHLVCIAAHPGWLAYELPEKHRTAKTGRGQVHKWLLYRFTGSDEDIRFDRHEKPEFRAVKRTTLAVLASETMPFRRGVYVQLAREFDDAIAPLRR